MDTAGAPQLCMYKLDAHRVSQNEPRYLLSSYLGDRKTYETAEFASSLSRHAQIQITT